MNIQEQYIYALEAVSMAYKHLREETPSVDLETLRDFIRELQGEITCQNLLVCDNVDSEKKTEIRTE